MPADTKKKRPNNNSTTQAAVVIAALTALETGAAKTKVEAAALAGTSSTALSPARLAIVARNPLLRSMVRTDPLDISTEVTRDDGSKGRISLREALSQGATRVVAKMAELQAKVGEWTKEQRETFAQCEKWLAVCRSMGLFKDGEGPPLPADLAGAQHDEPQQGQEWWMQHTNTHEQPPGLLTVLPPSEPAPPEDQPTTHAGNV